MPKVVALWRVIIIGLAFAFGIVVGVVSVNRLEASRNRSGAELSASETAMPSQVESSCTPQPACAPCPTSAPQPCRNPQVTGTVRLGELTGTYAGYDDNGRGCTLKVVHEMSDEPFDRMRFDLDCNRGGPTYNSGYAYGVMLLGRHNTAAYKICYERWPDWAEPCSIVFRFDSDSVELTQIGESVHCGFGHAVYADGIYQLIDRDVPELRCEERENNPCR